MAGSRIAGLVATCHASSVVSDGHTDLLARHSCFHSGAGDPGGANQNSTAIGWMLRGGLCRLDRGVDRLEPFLQSCAPIRCAPESHPLQPMANDHHFTAYIGGASAVR